MQQQVERAYVAPPETLEAPPMNELICFLDKDRACGPDCMGYTLNTPGEDYNEPSFHCMYLTSLFRISKHMIILAQQGSDKLKMQQTAAADQVRSSNGPVVQQFVPPVPKKVDP